MRAWQQEPRPDDSSCEVSRSLERTQDKLVFKEINQLSLNLMKVRALTYYGPRITFKPNNHCCFFFNVSFFVFISHIFVSNFPLVGKMYEI